MINEITAKIYIGATLKSVRLQFNQGQPRLLNVLEEITKTEWGNKLFMKEEEHLKLIPNVVVLIDGQPVQPWEYPEVKIFDGSTIAFIPFIAGG